MGTPRTRGAPGTAVTRRRLTRAAAAVSVPALIISQAAVALAAPAAPASSQAAQAPLTAALAAQLSRNVTKPVIVIMKNQFAAARVGSRAQAVRSARVVSSQAGLRSELSQVHATHMRSYRLVNAMAATVSAGEEARLKANPAVRQVIPDVMIRGAQPEQITPASSGHAAAPALKAHVIPRACGKNGKVLLDPEGWRPPARTAITRTPGRRGRWASRVRA